MTQGSAGKPEGDVLLNRDTTTMVRELAVYDSNPGRDVIQARPADPGLTVRHNADRSRDPGVRLHTKTGGIAATLKLSGQESHLSLGTETAGPIVDLDASRTRDGLLQVRSPQAPAPMQAAISTVEAGGRVRIYHDEVSHPGVDVRATQSSRSTPGGGRLALRPREDTPTVALDARDASLVLRGRASGTPTSGEFSAGPSLVLQQYASRDVPENVQIHVSGEQASNYGLDVSNRPRVRIDGYEATVELGRGEAGGRYAGLRGGFNLRGLSSGSTNELLVAEALPGSSAEKSRASLLMRNDDGNSLATTAEIESQSDGLQIRDATNSPAVLLDTSGVLKTANAINRTALSNVGPRIVGPVPDIPLGTVGEIELTAGDDSTFTVRIAGGSSPSYTIDATVTPASDARLVLRFDTSAAGSASQTLSIVGDASLSVTSETRLAGSLSTADYEIAVSDTYGSDDWYFDVT